MQVNALQVSNSDILLTSLELPAAVNWPVCIFKLGGARLDTFHAVPSLRSLSSRSSGLWRLCYATAFLSCSKQLQRVTKTKA